jgi:hypothetical protein
MFRIILAMIDIGTVLAYDQAVSPFARYEELRAVVAYADTFY